MDIELFTTMGRSLGIYKVEWEGDVTTDSSSQAAEGKTPPLVIVYEAPREPWVNQRGAMHFFVRARPGQLPLDVERNPRVPQYIKINNPVLGTFKGV
jgi:hypothetical protein